jgi:hypothetical protein
MFRFSISNLLKFLIGVLMIQGVTILLVVTAMRTDLQDTGPLFGAIGLAIGVLTALWFTSIADSAGRRAVAKVKEDFSREREKIRVRAEQEKAKEVQNTHRQLSKEQRRAQNSYRLKTGVMVMGGAVGLGTLMLFSQFMTLGLLTLATAGGAAVGYRVRSRQDRLSLSKWRPFSGEKQVEVIEVNPARPALNDSREVAKALRED